MYSRFMTHKAEMGVGYPPPEIIVNGDIGV